MVSCYKVALHLRQEHYGVAKKPTIFWVCGGFAGVAVGLASLEFVDSFQLPFVRKPYLFFFFVPDEAEMFLLGMELLVIPSICFESQLSAGLYYQLHQRVFRISCGSDEEVVVNPTENHFEVKFLFHQFLPGVCGATEAHPPSNTSEGESCVNDDFFLKSLRIKYGRCNSAVGTW